MTNGRETGARTLESRKRTSAAASVEQANSQTNVFGPAVSVNRAFQPAMRAARGGLVVSLSSVVGA